MNSLIASSLANPVYGEDPIVMMKAVKMKLSRKGFALLIIKMQQQLSASGNGLKRLCLKHKLQKFLLQTSCMTSEQNSLAFG